MVGIVIGIRNWLQQRASCGRWVIWTVGVGAGLVLVGGGWWLATSKPLHPWSMPFDRFASDREVTAAQEVVLTWLTRDYPAEWGRAQVVFGPSNSLPLWKFPKHFDFEQIPIEVNNWDAMQDYLWQTQPQYLIIDSDTARQRRSALEKVISFNSQGVDFKQLPAGWTLAYLHKAAGPPYAWSIFTPFRQPAQLVKANFGDQIELLGYDIVLDEKAQTLHVALYWRAKVPISNDYTAFLHLTTPDGFVMAKQDRSPFDGQWPTSRWQTGDVLADRFEIPLDEKIFSGDYLLLSGFFDPASGERLPLVAGPMAPSADSVLVGTLQFD